MANTNEISLQTSEIEETNNDIKLDFHVPMYRYVSKVLEKLEYQEFREELIDVLH